MMAQIESNLLRRPSLRLWLVPLASTVAGSMMVLLPIVVTAPSLPPFGLLIALGWRLRRPELWPAWVALPLGLADDLIGGAPLGVGMALWTLAFLGIDIADHRPMWRDYWLDWWLAMLAILFVGIGGWVLTAFAAGGGALWPLLPQLGFAILLFPVVQRLCGWLDQWRLRR
ncbi:rod shape-determining protein MreD [Sphingomonas nostoxanthinifaciens]|uniref:rod shape-determining protein MreD n=1 Tax=Sphingomonas nostoxanthinifaciens TaxID=2872652 RepID=UPI001CC1D660|nr:rod shape-determining protein MreD [Sphingomonas nostoxanthinifaciens]UAK23707.1 rod shape-determining protein MreD [Sphingomonas nostoxanthinifaciens]